MSTPNDPYRQNPENDRPVSPDGESTTPDQQAPQYGQQAPQYGQQAPQYGQQAPQYGQQAPQYGQPGQGQYSAAPPVSGEYGAAPSGYTEARPPSNGMGLAALILGVVAVLGAWIPLVNLISIVLAILGIVLGFMGLRKVKRREATNRGMALTGIILSAFALLVSIVISIALGAFIGSNIDELQDCADPNLTTEEQQACIEDQLGN
jgi:hypothetical protein